MNAAQCISFLSMFAPVVQRVQGWIQDFSRRRWGGGGWWLQNQWDMFPKCCNLRIGTELKTITQEILAMLQSRNYSKVPVQRGCLCFCLNIHNLFQFFFMLLLLQKGLVGAGWQATQSIPPPSHLGWICYPLAKSLASG